MRLKVLHTADLHLGMTFNNRDYPADVRQQLVEARFKSLEELVSLANREKCHLLLIAGDLFHRTNIAAEQVVKTVDILKGFSGLTALLPGNHDYYEAHGQLWPMLKELAFEELILLTGERPYNFKEYGLDLSLYPAPCTSRHAADNRLAWISALSERPQTRWHIGIAHGTLRGVAPDLKDQYYPMDEGELTALKMDLWLLGHTHKPYPEAGELNNPPYLYSGTPEPDGFDCRHEGSAWLVDFMPEAIQAAQVITGHFNFMELEKEIWSVEELRSLENSLAAYGKQTLLKLRLSGTLPADEYENRHTFYRKIDDQLFYLERDDSGLGPELNAEVIAESFPAGSFPGRFLERLYESGNRDALQLAYRLIEEVRK